MPGWLNLHSLSAVKVKIIFAVLVIAAIAGPVWFFNRSLADEHGQRAYDHTAAILAIGPRPAGSDGQQKARDYISAELAKSGWVTVTQVINRKTPVGEREFTNLIARFQADGLKSHTDLGRLPAKGILAAHLDSKEIPDQPDFLGADDAASACALIIELATTLAQENPDLAKQLEIVFFDGEESFNKHIDLEIGDGLYGSRAYAIKQYGRSPKPEFGIVLDMVGHKNLKIAVPSDTPPHLHTALTKAAEKHGYEKHFGMARGPIIDDHLYLNKAGIPTIDIIGAFGDSHWWHEEGDNMELISAESLTISYHVSLTMLRELLAK